MILRAFHIQQNFIILWVAVMVVACTSSPTPTPNAPTVNVQITTSTPFPTPLAQFATATGLPQNNNNAQSIQPTIIPSDIPELITYAGQIQAQGDAETVSLYNGPKAVIKEEVNDLASITILGRSDDGQWLEVRLSSGIGGWLPTNNVRTQAVMSNLRITGYVPQETPTPSPDAIVKSDANGLRLRTQPNTESNVLINLASDDILTVIGRNRDSQWLQVISPERQRGWVMAQFVDIYVDVLRLPITFGADPVATGNNPPASQPTEAITNITAEARRIFDRGLGLGNRANVFSKVGDSITVATWAFYPIGWGQQQLGSYGYLQSAIDYFSAEIIRDGNNSFSNITLSADNQWTSNDILNPALGNPEICSANETPLDCEYRITRPAISLILIGTNDVGVMDGATYRRNLEAILDKTIGRSILPVLSTLPQRRGYETEVEEFNAIIRQTAQQYQIPIWELHDLLAPQPNNGLDPDGVHPSFPPDTLGQWEAAANFIGDKLNYGYNMRNLSAIQALDALWRQVILNEGSS